MGHVIRDDINHQIHATRMKSVDKVLEVRGRAKAVIERIDLLSPVAMVAVAVDGRTFYVLHDRRDPDSREAHVLDVIEVFNQALPCS